MRSSGNPIRGARAVVMAISLGVIAAMTGSALVRGGSVNAQEKPAARPDATTVVTDLGDIETMRVLYPLKLQPDQLDKLVAALTTAQADYEKRVNALGTSVFAPSAAEVRDIRKQVLGGAAIPKDFDDRMKKLQTDFLKRRDDLNTENIQHVAGACRAVFNDKQVAAATKMERDQWEKDHPDSKNATDTQLFNLFCVEIFISNPRSIPLLKEIRAAAPK